MPRNPRCVAAYLAYRVTQRGVDRTDVFCSRADRDCYLGLAAQNLADCLIQVLAWCLMSKHVHWIVRPGHANSLAVFFRRVHGRYAQYLNARRGRTGHLWQNRFFSCALGPSYLWQALQYVESNPTRAGLVDDDAEYPWSSAAAHLTGPGSEDVRLLNGDFWREAGGAKFWRRRLQQPQDIRQVRTLHECTYSGKPFGDEAFVSDMEQGSNRQWVAVGRPKAQTEKRPMGTERSVSRRKLRTGTGSG